MDEGSLVVYVLDGDAAVREALGRLMGAEGYEVRTCATEADLVRSADILRPGCVLFDLRMPLSAPLAPRLTALGIRMPLIALTLDTKERAEADARRQGAAFLLHKPVDARALVDAIRWVTHKAGH